MKTINRYLVRQANRTIFVIVMALLSLMSLFGLYEELDESEATYGFLDSVSFIVATIPRRLDELLVYGVFLGYLVALGRFAETHELTAMRAAGMSPWRILLALAPSLLLWISINVLVSEWVAPSADRTAEANKIQAQYGVAEERVAVGLWLRIENLYMRVQAIDANGDIWGITQYQMDDQRQLQSTISAEKGTFDPLTRQWFFSNAVLTEFNSQGTPLSSASTPLQMWIWENPITPELLASNAFLDPDKMSMASLFQQINYAEQENVTTHEIAFWSRLMKPLSYLGLCAFALAAVLGPLREASASFRVSVGIFAGLGFKYLQDLFAPAAIVFNLPAWLGVLIPILICYLVAARLLRRQV
ncbi:MAG: LPS export ABC transporter permease LptG [Pseudomonadota bacterium]